MSRLEVERSMTNYYLVLDIVPGVSQNEIHHAYKRAKMTYSQDSLAAYSLIEEENTSQILDEIEKAYEILGHPSKRREYDIKMGFSTWSDEEVTREQLKDELSRPSVTSDSEEKEDLVASNPFDSIDYSGGVGEDSSNDVPAGAKVEKNFSEAESTPHIRVVSKGDSFGDEESYEPNEGFEDEIQECTSLSGEFLKAVRVYRQLSVEQLANCTKLSATRISSLEEEDVENYPLPVYLRGHVAIICQALRIPDAEKLARTYVDRLREEGKLPKSSF